VLAVIAFDFDPILRLDIGTVPWETVGIAGALLVALIGLALMALRAPASGDLRPRLDDALFIILGIVPGAVVGARLGYLLIHLDYYRTDTGALLDPTKGAFELTLGIVGGLLTGLLVARMLGAPIRAWLHLAAVPVLIAIEGGKLAMAWGGAGQGARSLEPWSTAYFGPGPWGSLAPALPSIPSQIIEGTATGALVAILVLALAAGAFRSRDGRFFLVAAGAWLLVRLTVAGTWRDPVVLGPLNADQVISGVLLVTVGVSLALASRRAGRPQPQRVAADEGQPAWPGDDAARTWRAPPPAS
jgi:phosphatidylglycerol:prolipoprotein diacylglycerol transferase